MIQPNIDIEPGKVNVIGRNGYGYDATPLNGKLYIVGKYIVVVEDGKCRETICRATKANVRRYANSDPLIWSQH
jgi:hypothetical protein